MGRDTMYNFNVKGLLVFSVLTRYFGISGALQIKKCCGEDEFLSESTQGCEKTKDKLGGTRQELEKMISRMKLGHLETILLNKGQVGPPQCLQGEEISIQNAEKLEGISGNRILLIVELDHKNSDNFTRSIGVSTNRICIDKSEDASEVFVMTCLPNCDGFETFCLRKCCNSQESIDSDLFMCTNSNDSSNISPGLNTNLASLSKANHFGQPPCNGRDSYEIDFENNHLYKRLEILPSGNLFLETTNNEPEVIPWTEFCLDRISSSEPENADLLAIVCYPSHQQEDNEDPLKRFRELLYPSFFSISSIFLLITSTIYVILWKDLNLPGWLQFSYVNSLLISFALLAVLHFWSQLIYDSSHTLCRLLGYTLHTTFLSSFFWLTCMNIDLWCSFKHTPIITSFGRSRAKRRYVAFGFFSTVIPLGVTLLAVLVDDFTREQRDLEKPQESFAGPFPLVSTGIGRDSCALKVSNKFAMLFYFYGVVGLLLLINLMFFFCTVLCLRERQRETKFAHRQSTANNSDPEFQRFKLFTRLFFIMGVLWIFELISWIFSTFFSSDWILLQRLFVITDSFNALQGLAIFCIFIWKPQTWKQLRKKLCKKSYSHHNHPFLLGGSLQDNKSRLSSTSTKSSSIVSKHNTQLN